MRFRSVKVDESFYDIAKCYAVAEHRTISSQISYWAILGKLSLENPDLPINFIRDILVANNLKEVAEPFKFRVD